MSIPYEKIRNNPGVDAQPPKHWPSGVRSISIEGLSLIGVDHDGRIYYDGKPIAYQATLAGQERIIAWIIAISTLASAIGTLVQAYFSWK